MFRFTDDPAAEQKGLFTFYREQEGFDSFIHKQIALANCKKKVKSQQRSLKTHDYDTISKQIASHNALKKDNKTNRQSNQYIPHQMQPPSAKKGMSNDRNMFERKIKNVNRLPNSIYNVQLKLPPKTQRKQKSMQLQRNGKILSEIKSYRDKKQESLPTINNRKQKSKQKQHAYIKYKERLNTLIPITDGHENRYKFIMFSNNQYRMLTENMESGLVKILKKYSRKI